MGDVGRSEEIDELDAPADMEASMQSDSQEAQLSSIAYVLCAIYNCWSKADKRISSNVFKRHLNHQN
jgi:hypothetical protein